jgi:hypothetical protein
MTLTPAEKIARIKEKEAKNAITQETLPGFENPTEHTPGNLEQATRRSLNAMYAAGFIAEIEEFRGVLALEAAQIWDEKASTGGKLSGISMYLNAVNAVFGELPKAEVAAKTDGANIDDLISAIMDNDAA